MNTLLKEELHQLIDNCNDEAVLQRVKALFIGDNGLKNWWDELEADSIETGTESLISHANVMQLFNPGE